MNPGLAHHRSLWVPDGILPSCGYNDLARSRERRRLALVGRRRGLQMKYFPLIWSGLWRNPTRTTLTALSVIAAFLVLGLLQNVSAFFAGLVSTQRDDRIHVHPKHGMWLPFSYLQRIE